MSNLVKMQEMLKGNKVEYNASVIDCNDVVGYFESDVSSNSSSYICDLISGQADSSTPVYYSDIWKDAEEIEDYINDGINEFGTDGKNIVEIMQMGYYQCYQSCMYDNLEAVLTNVGIDKVLEEIEEIENLDKIDLEVFEDCISDLVSELEGIASDEYCSVIDDKVQTFFNLIEPEEDEELEG